jgi:hypothetical protein
MHIPHVVAARPNFRKAAPVMPALVGRLRNGEYCASSAGVSCFRELILEGGPIADAQIVTKAEV